jgi:hypothetical protein
LNENVFVPKQGGNKPPGWPSTHDFPALEKSDHSCYQIKECDGETLVYDFCLDYLYELSSTVPVTDPAHWASGVEGPDGSLAATPGYTPVAASSLEWNLENTTFDFTDGSSDPKDWISPPTSTVPGTYAWEYEMDYEFKVEKYGLECFLFVYEIHNSPSKGAETVTVPVQSLFQTLVVVKELEPPTDPGRFDLWIDGTKEVANAGHLSASDATTVAIGTHTVSESAVIPASLDAYSTTVQCIDQEDNLLAGPAEETLVEVYVGAGDQVTCTFLNISSTAESESSLTVIKQLVPSTDPGTFDLWIDGKAEASGIGDGEGTGAVPVEPGFVVFSETGALGLDVEDYFFSYSCVDQDGGEPTSGRTDHSASVQVGVNDDVTCTITNTRKAYVTVIKQLESTELDKFYLWIDSGYSNPVGDNGVYGPVGVMSGTHAVSETAFSGDLANYTTTIGCEDATGRRVTGPVLGTSTSFDIAYGESVTCTITNTLRTATLILSKTVVNDAGGNAVAGDFQAYLDDDPVDWFVAYDVLSGFHSVSETVLAWYAAGDWGGDCDPDGDITVEWGNSYTCTITNDDTGPTIIVPVGGATAPADTLALLAWWLVLGALVAVVTLGAVLVLRRRRA